MLSFCSWENVIECLTDLRSALLEPLAYIQISSKDSIESDGQVMSTTLDIDIEALLKRPPDKPQMEWAHLL